MASNYPGSLDSFDTIASDKKTSDSVGGRTHRDMHNDLGDAVESIQGELGTNPSGSDATVAARLTAIEAGTNLAANSVGSTQIAANAVGSSELADNAVDTAAIADSAVTSAKIADGTIVDADVSASAAIAASKIAGLGNLLSANQASIETDTTGWQRRAEGEGNHTIARTGDASLHGSASLRITATDTNTFQRVEIPSAYRIAASPGETFTGMAYIRNSVAGRSGNLVLCFYDSGGSLIGYPEVLKTSMSANTWYELQVTGVAPASTATVGLIVGTVGTTAVSDVTYLDCFSVHRGAGGLWQAPGVPIPNLGTRTNPSNSAQVQVWNPGNATWITV